MSKFSVVEHNEFVQAYIGLTEEEIDEITEGLESLMKDKNSVVREFQSEVTGDKVIVRFDLIEKEMVSKRIIMSKIDVGLKILGGVGVLYTIYLIFKYIKNIFSL